MKSHSSVSSQSLCPTVQRLFEAGFCPTLQRLRQAGIYPTHQRLRIARWLFTEGGHHTAQEIFEALNGVHTAVCRATVYNTLNLLVRRGLAMEIHLDNESTVYDADTKPHHHLYNEDTGELTDVPLGAVALDQLPQLPAGVHPEDISLIIRVRPRPRM